MRNSSRKTVLKRVLAYALALALTLSVITVPSTDAYAASGSVKSVTVTNLPAKQVTIKKGKSFVLKTKVTTSGKISKAVVYKSSNSKVAKVTKTGKITAVKKGSTYVTVYAKANKKKVCKVKVTVGTPVSSVKLSKASATIKKGKTLTLKATVSPKSASNKTLTWKSSNKKVATVSSKGVVKAVGAGTAKITATANDGSGKKYTCTVKVNIPVSSVKLSKASAVLTEGDAVTLKATVAPSNASNKSVKWSTSNAKVATVSAGKVTAKSAGTATITAAAADGSGKKAVCKITVKAKPVINPEVKVSEISLSLADNTIYVGEKTQASVVVAPENATNKKVVYSVSDETVATIDAKTGVIEAKKEGSVTVTATAVDGSGTHADQILKVEGVPTVSFAQKSKSLAVGDTATLSITDPTLAVKYISSNESVVSVLNASTGQIKAIAAGKATITVSLADMPEVKDTCTVVVVNDNTVMITGFAGLTQEGIFTVNVSMLSDTNIVTDSMLIGTKLYITNEKTGKKITAAYVSGSLINGVATYAFNSSEITSGTYVLGLPSDSIFAINSGSVDDLKQTITVTELKTGIAGHVCDNENNDVEGAEVSCLAGDKVIKTTKTDASGYYEMELAENSGYTIAISKIGYFDTTSDTGIVVKANEVTTNDMTIESIDDSKLAIMGHVVLDSTVDQNNNKLEITTKEAPVATLYVKVNDEWKAMASAEVSNDGYYAFMNSNELLLTDAEYSKYFPYYGDNYFVFYSYNTEKLSTSDSYKIVITKGLSSNNYDTVYDEATVPEFTLSKTDKVTKFLDTKETKLIKTTMFKGLNIAASSISWNKDCKPDTDKTDVKCVISSEDDETFVRDYSVEVEVDATGQHSVDKAVEVIPANELSLPEGYYHLAFSNTSCATVYKTIYVDKEGSTAVVKDVDFAPAVNYTFTVRVKTDNSFFVNNPNLDEGDIISLTDIYGKSNSNNAYLKAAVYEVTSSGKEVKIRDLGKYKYDPSNYKQDPRDVSAYSYLIDTFKVVNLRGALAIEYSEGIPELINGRTYRIRFSSPVLSLYKNGSNENESYDINKGYYEFTYDGRQLNNLIPEVTMQSNIQNIKLTSSSQFSNTNKPLFVNKVTLVDENGKDVKTCTINKWYSCGVKLSENDQQRVDSPIYGGGSLIDDGIDVSSAFANIDPGKYSISISVNGYEKLTVPVPEKDKTLEGLSQGEFTVSDNFKLIENTNIAGLLVDKNNDPITDQVDITVINKKGIVVAVDKITSANKGEYKVISGKDSDTTNPNRLNVGEEYTVIFRSRYYAVKAVSVAALQAGVNKQDNIKLEKATGDIKATIYEAGTENALIKVDLPEVTARDSKYVDEDDVNNFISEEVQAAYKDLDYNGSYDMHNSPSNEAFWSVTGVAKESYTVHVNGKNTKTYDSVDSEKSVTIDVQGDIKDIGNIDVPRATSIKTTPVRIKIIKDSIVDSNAGGFDLIKVYSVDANGVETYITSQRHDCKYDGSELTYTCSDFNLEKGKYVVYVYSKNYYRGVAEITVSEISEDVLPKTISLTAAKN